jgi:hypothetical protein
MRKSLFVLAALLLAAMPAFAGGHAGQNGLGLLYSDAPIGYFRGLSDDATLHIGLDINSPDGGDDDDDGDPTLGFTIAGALEYDIWGGEGWGFGLFPGIAFSSQSFEDVGGVSRDSETNFHIAANLGGHVDLHEHVSLFFKHGLNIDISDSGAPNADSTTDISTAGWTLGQLGLCFWLP